MPDYVGKMHGGPYMWIARRGHYGKWSCDTCTWVDAMLNTHNAAKPVTCDSQVVPTGNNMTAKKISIHSTFNVQHNIILIREGHVSFILTMCTQTHRHCSQQKLTFLPV